mmetsp:Transcript_26004/g.56756  ORF Transcript_26004/g.56756 Transcript_26004/m.56756 type:complete len:751 (+) Transcript_26004:79-2331(+)
MAKSLAMLVVLLHTLGCRADRDQVFVTHADGHFQQARRHGAGHEWIGKLVQSVEDWGHEQVQKFRSTTDAPSSTSAMTAPPEQVRMSRVAPTTSTRPARVAPAEPDEYAETLADASAMAKEVMKVQSSNICGGSEIRELITQSSAASSVRNLNWNKVMKIADDYIQEETHQIAQLTKDVEMLQSNLHRQLELEKAAPISKDAIVGLITSAVIAGYEDLKDAQQTRCSGKSIRRSVQATGKRGRIGTLRQQQASEAAFATEVEAYFKAHQERSDAQLFQTVCMELLSTETTDLAETNCDEFCLALGAVIQRASDDTAGTKGVQKADQISQQLERKINDLQFAIRAKGDCESAKQQLGAFQKELTKLIGDIENNWQMVLVAQDEFDEADMAFEDLQDELKSQRAVTQDLQAIFAQNSESMMTAKKVFDDVEAKKAALHIELDQTMEKVSIAKKALGKASAAGRALFAVRTAVSNTLVSMVNYFDEAVRVPVSNLGLNLDTQISDYFMMDVPKDSAMVVAHSVEALSNFCEVVKPSFESVKDHVDLSPMCALGGTIEEISQGIDQAVLSRANLVQMNLETAMSFLNPYQGQKGMTSEKAQERVDAGEPEGLQEVKGVLRRAPFWHLYLKNWELEGTFLPLYNELGAILQDMTNAKEAADAAVQATMANLQEMVELAMQAREALKTAMAAAETSEHAKQEAEQILASLEQDGRDQEEILRMMKEASTKAMQAYEQAKANLESAHSRGLAALVGA